MTASRIDAERLGADLATLAEHGATPAGAVTRIAYSDADLEARDWLDAQLSELGMTVRRDQGGTSIAVLEGTDPTLATIAVGSHTDTVPDGGRYDGALGVVAGLACVRALRDAGSRLRHPLAVINFEAEEATMAGGTFGSRAFVGRLEPDATERQTFDGRPIGSHLEDAGLDPGAITSTAEGRPRLAAFLELHVEQGPVLEAAREQIGIVDGIVGIRRYAVSFEGVANHAGTTPMAARDDALVAAAPFVVAARDLAVDRGLVATVGTLRVSPGAANVIPGRVTMDLELRSADERLLEGAERDLDALAAAAGGELERLSAKPPLQFSDRVRERLEAVCEELGLSHRRMWSGGGHDAGPLASVTDAAMVFVPSRGGFSHSVREFTAWEDCAAGAEVLHGAVLDLDSTLS